MNSWKQQHTSDKLPSISRWKRAKNVLQLISFGKGLSISEAVEDEKNKQSNMVYSSEHGSEGSSRDGSIKVKRVGSYHAK